MEFGAENKGVRSMPELNREARQFIIKLEDTFRIRGGLVSTGPRPEDTIDRRPRRW